MAIANVYIDGFNLYYGALKRSPFKWLDVRMLTQALLPGDTIQEIHYFTARVSSRPSSPNSSCFEPVSQHIDRWERCFCQTCGLVVRTTQEGKDRPNGGAETI